MSVNSTFVLLTPGEFRAQGDDTLAMGMGNRISIDANRARDHELLRRGDARVTFTVFNML